MPIILGEGSYFGDWEQVQKAPGFVALAFAVYGAGQLGIWLMFLASMRWLSERTPFAARDLVLALAFFVALFLLPGMLLLAYFRSCRDKEYEFTVEEPGHSWRVRLVETHTVKGVPAYDELGGNYTCSTLAVSPGRTFHCVRPLKLGGELCTWKPEGGVRREAIPEPAGFQATYAFNTYFDRPVLLVGPRGEQFIRWDIEANGDHGVALRTGSDGPFTTARIKLYLATSMAICSPNGAWYLLVIDWDSWDNSRLSVYSVNSRLQLSHLGTHRSWREDEFRSFAAAFDTKRRLHIVWRGSEPELAPGVRENWLRLRAIDLDVQTKVWSAEREVWRLDRSVGAGVAGLHVLEDGSTHYLWTVHDDRRSVKEERRRTTVSGLFYQAKDTGPTIKLAERQRGCDSLVVSGQIVVCYTLENEPEKVYFQVLREGRPGPATAITLVRRPKRGLGGGSMVLGSDKGQNFWFVNTLDPGTLYLLEVVDGK